MQRRRTQSRKRRTERPALTLETKWGWMPSVEMGWCPIPTALLRYASALAITPEEGWMLIHLLDIKWSEGRSTLDHLSERCRLSPDEIYHRLQCLESRGFLKLIPKHLKGASSNGAAATHFSSQRPLAGWEIDLSPLLHALNEMIMRGGDLNAGFLRLSPVQLENEPE